MKLLFRQIFMSALGLALITGLTGCGGSDQAKPSDNNKLTSKIVMGALVSNNVVGALRLTISLPYGVTVPLTAGVTSASDQATINALNSVVQVTGSNIDINKLLATVNYTPPTPLKPGSIEIAYLKADGFIPNFNTILIQFDITKGYFPSPQDFILSPITIATFTPDDPATPLVDESAVSAETPVTNIQYTVSLI